MLNASGTWASAADVLAPNADGFDAAAHIFVTSSPANASNGAIVTGFAAEAPPTEWSARINIFTQGDEFDAEVIQFI